MIHGLPDKLSREVNKLGSVELVMVFRGFLSVPNLLRAGDWDRGMLALDCRQRITGEQE